MSSVRIFPQRNKIKKPLSLAKIPDEDKKSKLNILVNTASNSIVFEDILNQGLGKDVRLRNSNSTTCVLCSCIADINMDNQNEILLGTYEREVLVFSNNSETWELTNKKLFDAPIHSICYTDLSGDGVNELVVLTQRSVHILQHDTNKIKEIWKERFQKMIGEKVENN